MRFRRIVKMFSFVLVTFLMIGVMRVNALSARVGYQGKQLIYEFTDDDTVLELKEKLVSDTKVEKDRQHLIFIVNNQPKVMEDDEKLSDYFTMDGMTASLLRLVPEEKKFLINSIVPDEDTRWAIFENISINEGINIGDCNSTFTECNALDMDDNYYTNIKISYNYDNSIKLIVDKLISKLPSDKDSYGISDIELFNYWLNGGSIMYYSSELMGYLNNKNFEIDFRAGEEAPLMTESYGIATFMYNGTIYYINTWLGIVGEHILYVPSDTDVADYMKVAQERLDKIFGSDKIKLEKYNDPYQLVGQDDPVFNQAEDGNIYKVMIGDKVYYTLIKADDSKIKKINYMTSDVATDISIATDKANISYDTLIKAKKITSGEEYQKILKILNLTNGEMFDLKLFSQEANSYVTELTDGTFEVRIPLTDAYKGKKLVVYYVDDNNEVTTYQVVEEDGYAVFNTSHFSIYTLGVSSEINNPQTSDKIIRDIVISLISFISTLGCGIYLKKKYN